MCPITSGKAEMGLGGIVLWDPEITYNRVDFCIHTLV